MIPPAKASDLSQVHLAITDLRATGRSTYPLINVITIAICSVTFGEDACRVRKDHGSRNLNALRKFTLSLLKQENTCKNGIATERGKAGWDDACPEEVLLFSQI